MNYRITISDSKNKYIPTKHPIIFNNDLITIEGDCANLEWEDKDGSVCILLGDLLGGRDKNKVYTSLKNYKNLADFKKISEFEGRFVIVKISKNNCISVWTDNFGRANVYWVLEKEIYFITSGKEMIPRDADLGSVDQNGLAQVLSIYGSRPLKKHTLNKKLNRLGINEKLTINDNKLSVDKTRFVPKVVFKKDDYSKLKDYSNLFIEAVRARASDIQNIVLLSSGWDSTSILATLCHLFSSDKIECVIGRMRYSKRSKIINQFELDRAQKFADYYNVKLHVIDLDYTKDANKIRDEVLTLFRSHEFFNLTGYNHWQLAKGASKISKQGAVVFAGEISDGAHNLGFSQYFSLYHPESIAFREYSDKMATYLFGPTFLKQLIEGKYADDPVWKIFMSYNTKTKFDQLKKGDVEIKLQILESFFLSGGRIPLYSKFNNQLLTENGIKKFLINASETYLSMFKDKIEYDNLYSHYLHLYHSFHWQGGTVATLEHTCESFGLKCRLPFLDKGVIDFLSQMPESWGRGLDINNTKYPLKWMLINKIDYPIDYQSGPHSYLYDINPTFSHTDEIVNASSFKKLFKDAFQRKNYLDSFSPEYFDLNYIERIVKKYCEGENVYGQEMTDILNIGNYLIISQPV